MKLWDRGAPKRVGVLFGVLAALGVALHVAFIRMPGQSFRGPLPALSPEQTALAATLRRHVTTLARDIGERNWRKPDGLRRAADFIEAELARAGCPPTRQTYTHEGQAYANIECTIAGGGEDGEQIVLVGAHYDSAEGSPGGNDNGTGVAVLLSLADAFHLQRPARTLRFVAFTNEEPPFFQAEGMGSPVYAKAARARGDRIVAMVSLETLGCYSDREGSQHYPMPGLSLLYPTRGNFLGFVGMTGDRDLVRYALATFRREASFPSEGTALPSFVPGVDWSDHGSFAEAGYPAFMVSDTAIYRDEAYHTEHDDAEHIDYERLARVTTGMRSVVQALLIR